MILHRLGRGLSWLLLSLLGGSVLLVSPARPAIAGVHSVIPNLTTKCESGSNRAAFSFSVENLSDSKVAKVWAQLKGTTQKLWEENVPPKATLPSGNFYGPSRGIVEFHRQFGGEDEIFGQLGYVLAPDCGTGPSTGLVPTISTHCDAQNKGVFVATITNNFTHSVHAVIYQLGVADPIFDKEIQAGQSANVIGYSPQLGLLQFYKNDNSSETHQFGELGYELPNCAKDHDGPKKIYLPLVARPLPPPTTCVLHTQDVAHGYLIDGRWGAQNPTIRFTWEPALEGWLQVTDLTVSKPGLENVVLSIPSSAAGTGIYQYDNRKPDGRLINHITVAWTGGLGWAEAVVNSTDIPLNDGQYQLGRAGHDFLVQLQLAGNGPQCGVTKHLDPPG